MLKGDSIVLEGKTYKHNDLTLLPEGCRPENTKLSYTDDGKGVGFQSELVFLSNFYPCEVQYRGHTYSSAEQAFQQRKLIDSGYTKLANEVLESDNPYTQKYTGGKITPTEKWSDFAYRPLYIS